MNSGEDDGSSGKGMRRHSNQAYDISSNKRQRHNGPDTMNTMHDLGRISQLSFGGGLDPTQAMSVNHIAGLRSSAGFLSNSLAPPPSFGPVGNQNFFANSYVDQRLFEHAKQQLRQGADMALISNLFQSTAIPAGNTEFAFSPNISIPVARTMLNYHPVSPPSSLALDSTGGLDSSSQSMASQRMNPLLSAVSLLHGRQNLLDSFASSQSGARWGSQGMQQSVEHAVHSAIANARQQEQLQQLQNASLAQELLQRYVTPSAEQSAANAATFNNSILAEQQVQHKLKKSSSPSLSYKSSSDGVSLAIPEDRCKLNDQQVFLREQIEAYPATDDDLTSHTRGRNKPILLGQIGIRCKHCNHLPTSQRGKGSTYFPSTLMGIYQAAQNMSVEHLQSGICTEMPPDVRNRFLTFGLTKPGASVAGKRYWADAAKEIGLVDTDNGIRFAKDVEIALEAEISQEVGKPAEETGTTDEPRSESMEE